MEQIAEELDFDPVKAPLKIFGKFLELSSVSVLIGIFCGVLATLMTKQCRFLTHSAVVESALLLAWGFLAYLISELLEMSAICSLLVISIIFGHYTWYNLSPQGQHVTMVTFQTLGYIAEALVFGYVGITSAWSFTN